MSPERGRRQPLYSTKFGSAPKISPVVGWIGPIALALLINAGPLKMNPLFSWIPIDLTLLLGLVVLIAFAVEALGPNVRLPRIWYPWVLIFLFTFALLPSSLQDYSLNKSAVLLAITICALMISPLLILNNQHRQKRFIVTLLAVAVYAGAFTLVAPETSSELSDRLVFGSTNTIVTARLVAVGVVIGAIWLFNDKLVLKRKLLIAIVLVPLVAILFLTGSRGPLISLVVAIGFVLFASPMLRRNLWRNLIVVSGIGLSIALVAFGQSGDGAQRILGFLAGNQDTSTLARVHFWEEALEAIPFHPFGTGWGDLSEVADFSSWATEDGRIYPHNIILELTIEGGWLVGIAALIYVVATVIRIFRLADGTTSAVISALAIFSVANAMVSGDINDNRLMWVALASIWVIPLRPHASRRPVIRWPGSDALKSLQMTAQKE